MATISRFPVSTWQRNWNKRGTRAVNCIVSGRWLRFGQLATTQPGCLPSGQPGTPIEVEVLTDTYDDKEVCKLCQLIVTYEELKALVDQLGAEMASRGKPT